MGTVWQRCSVGGAPGNLLAGIRIHSCEARVSGFLFNFWLGLLARLTRHDATVQELLWYQFGVLSFQFSIVGLVFARCFSRTSCLLGGSLEWKQGRLAEDTPLHSRSDRHHFNSLTLKYLSTPVYFCLGSASHNDSHWYRTVPPTFRPGKQKCRYCRGYCWLQRTSSSGIPQPAGTIPHVRLAEP